MTTKPPQAGRIGKTGTRVVRPAGGAGTGVRIKLDAIDLKILAALQRDGRLTNLKADLNGGFLGISDVDGSLLESPVRKVEASGRYAGGDSKVQ